jgi:hypothetical protein
LTVTKQLSAFLASHEKDIVVGETVLRLTASYGGEEPCYEHHHLLLACLVKKPRQESYVVLEATADGVDEAMMEQQDVEYPISFRLLVERGKVAFRTNYAVARHICKQDSLLSLKAVWAMLLNYEDTDCLSGISVTGVNDEAMVEINLGDGKVVHSRPTDAFAAALDAALRADRAEAGNLGHLAWCLSSMVAVVVV